jgi:hypothetical protein
MYEGASVTLMNGNLNVMDILSALVTFLMIFAVFFISNPPPLLRLFTLAFFPFGPLWSGEPKRG